MQKVRAALSAFSELTQQEKILLGIIAALIIVLIVVTCISINMRVNMQREYAAIRNRIGESLYSNLYMMSQTFDMASVPNVDIQNSILPQMRNYFAAATALNDLVANAFEQRYRLLSDADVNALRAAFNAYNTAFRNGSPTDLAQADMMTCINRVRELLASRYSEGLLRAGR